MDNLKDNPANLGLIGRWTFNHCVPRNVASGSTRHGTLYGTDGYSMGKRNVAKRIITTTNYIDIPNADAYLAPEKVTIRTRSYHYGYGSDATYSGIFTSNKANTANGYLILTSTDSGGIFKSFMYHPSLSQWSILTFPLFLNRWYETVTTNGGVTHRFYVNGREVANAALAGYNRGVDVSYIGRHYSDSYRMNGLVESVEVFNVRKTASQIASEHKDWITPVRKYWVVPAVTFQPWLCGAILDD